MMQYAQLLTRSSQRIFNPMRYTGNIIYARIRHIILVQPLYCGEKGELWGLLLWGEGGTCPPSTTTNHGGGGSAPPHHHHRPRLFLPI